MSDDRLRRVRVLISGRVQGVFFRVSTRDVATRAGATGWIRNLPDGRVEAEVQGAPEAVDVVLDHCRTGPPHARVQDVQVTSVDPVPGERGFAAL